MYVIPALPAIDASDALTAETIAHAELRECAVHFGGARRLSPVAAATTAFELVVPANSIKLAPATEPRG